MIYDYCMINNNYYYFNYYDYVYDNYKIKIDCFFIYKLI